MQKREKVTQGEEFRRSKPMYRLGENGDYDDHTPGLVRNDPYIEPYQPNRSGFQYTPEEYI